MEPRVLKMLSRSCTIKPWSQHMFPFLVVQFHLEVLGKFLGTGHRFFLQKLHWLGSQEQHSDKLGHHSCGARTALPKSTQWGQAQASGVTAVPGILWSLASWLPQAPVSFWKELSYGPSGKAEFLGLLGSMKEHNTHFVCVRQDILSQKGRYKQKIPEKRKETL